MSCSSSLSNKRRASDMAETWEVEGNDDILTVILVRLPASSIFRFRCVSKRWNCIIASPFFCQSYYILRKALAHRMVAYIRETYSMANIDNFCGRDSESITILPVSSRDSKLIDTKLCARGIYFVNSSNGLILFQTRPRAYLIFNPITKKAVNLTRPMLPNFCGTPAMALVCEENMHELVLNYKVVVAGKEEKEHSYLTINTFCSKTGKWTTSTPTATGRLNDTLHRYSSPHVVDGIIHWFMDTRLYLVVYYMDSSTIQFVELPSKCRDNYSSKVARSSRDDDLWLCTHMAVSFRIKFWMVSREDCDSYRSRSSTIPSNAWILMHEFNYSAPSPSPALASKEETTNRNCVYRRWWRGGVRRKVPYVDFYVQTHRDPLIFSRYGYSPVMEALTLSSYAL